MNINSKDANQVWDYKGWFWDDVNKEYYRWHELELLIKEREIKASNRQKLDTQHNNIL
jgi:hypothetical protein